MGERMGALERRKIRTRRALVESALRLFAEQGYERTTLAQICERAEIGERTFFNYFDGKDELVFFDDERRIELALDLVAGRAPGDSVVDLLLRVIDITLADTLSDNPLALEFAPLRRRLVREIPALQARYLRLLLEVERRLAVAFAEAFPDQLDPVSAAAAVGAMVGAVKTAGLLALSEQVGEAEVRALTRRVADIVVAGVGSLDRPG